MISAAAAFVACASSTAHADDEDRLVVASLDWAAPEGCVTASELAAAVAAELGHPFAPPDRAEVRVRGRVEHDGSFRATLELETSSGRAIGERLLVSDAPDCGPLSERVIVVLAIMLNVRPEELQALEDEPAQEPQSAPAVVIEAFAGVGLGLLPLPALEVIAGGGLRVAPALEVALEASWFWTTAVPADRGSLEVGALSFRIAASIAAADDRVEIAGRAAVGGGPMWARFDGLEVDRETAVNGLIEIRLGARLGVRIAGPLWLALIADLGFLPYRTTFELRAPDDSVVARFAPTAVFGSFGLGPRLIL